MRSICSLETGARSCGVVDSSLAVSAQDAPAAAGEVPRSSRRRARNCREPKNWQSRLAILSYRNRSRRAVAQFGSWSRNS